MFGTGNAVTGKLENRDICSVAARDKSGVDDLQGHHAWRGIYQDLLLSFAEGTGRVGRKGVTCAEKFDLS